MGSFLSFPSHALPWLLLRLKISQIFFGDSVEFGFIRGKRVGNRVSDGKIRAPWGEGGRNGGITISVTCPLRLEVKRTVRASCWKLHVIALKVTCLGLCLIENCKVSSSS
jgi:hypothetical protein